MFQDLAAIPLLAVVPLLGLSDSKSSGGIALPVLKAVLTTLLVYVLGRYVTRPILRRLAKTGLREVFTAFALLLVFGIAELMASVGVSMALGAFLAGVLLASSEYRHALESDIQPFKGLLMGLFFIAVGMSIDFSLLASEPALVLTVLFGFQILKGAVLAVLAPRIGVRKEQAALFSALLVQGGEFAVVVFGVARGARLFSGNWDGVLTLSVALSMALTPVLLLIIEKLAERRPRAAREHDTIRSEDSEVIIAGFGRFGQIVGRLLMASSIRATVLDHDP